MCEQKQETLGAEIHKRMAGVLADVMAVGKNGYNDFSKFSYRRVDDIMTSVHGAMKRHGVYFLPEVIDSSLEGCTTSSGKPATHAVLKMKYTFIADDGSSISSVFVGESIDTGDKATSQALQLALKYFLATTFMIPFNGMDDGDSKTSQRGSQDRRPNNGGSQGEPSNGSGGKYPLTWQLFKVAKAFDMSNQAIETATRNALKIAESERSPKIIDIKNSANQQAVLAKMITDVEVATHAHSEAAQWLKGAKLKSWSEFAERAAAGAFSMTHIENIAAIFKGALDGSGPQDAPPDEPEAELPRWKKAVNVFKQRGVSQQELEAALGGKSPKSWSDNELLLLGDVYTAMAKTPSMTLDDAIAQAFQE